MTRSTAIAPRPSRLSVVAAEVEAVLDRCARPLRRARVPAASHVLVFAFILAMALFAVYVWPTRYRYETAQVLPTYMTVVRIDRFTGRSEYLVNGTWLRSLTYAR